MRFNYGGKANLGGIYRILNLVNGRFYIGSTFRFKTRWPQHEYALRRGAHSNRALQGDFHESGTDAFAIEVVQVVLEGKEARIALEEDMLASHFDSQILCYNATVKCPPSQEGLRKGPCPAGTKAKIRAAKIGADKPTREVIERRRVGIRAAYAERGDVIREKLKAVHLGSNRPESTREKMREAWVRRKARAAQPGLPLVSDAQREQLRAVYTTEESVAKFKARMGTEEIKAKRVESWKKVRPRGTKRTPTPERTKEKIRASKIGKPRTEAAKAAMRAGHARRRERLASEDRT
jgi:group I intron endonuclease